MLLQHNYCEVMSLQHTYCHVPTSNSPLPVSRPPRLRLRGLLVRFPVRIVRMRARRVMACVPVTHDNNPYNV